MRIEEFSTDLTYFARHIRRKFKLKYLSVDGKPNYNPVMFFGCGGLKQKQLVKDHKGLTVVVWGGSDSMRLKDKSSDMVPYFKENKDRVFHIAHSHWIQKDLEEVGIDYIDRVVLPVEFDKNQFTLEPLGDCVYHYGPVSKTREDFYGTTIVKKIMHQNGNNHVLATNKFIVTNAYAIPRDKLHHEYKKCFVGVRLTDHDNMALSCIEMGLMGRRSIFNGNIPGAVPYEKKEVGEISKLILEEYRYNEPDKYVSEEMWDFVQDDQKWLDSKYYE